MKYAIAIQAIIILALFAWLIFHKNNNAEMNVVPFPAPAQWTEVFHDNEFKLINKNNFDFPGIEFNIEGKAITLNKQFDSAIAWKEDQFLNIITFGRISSGAELARVDTRLKTLVYQIPLVGIGPIDHSQYGNRVRVFVSHDIVMILGDETGGCYRELRTVSDGSLVYLDQKYKSFNRPRVIEIK